jgi:hypothetical protein
MASLCKHRNYYAIKFVRAKLSLAVMVDAIRSMAIPVNILHGPYAGQRAWLSSSHGLPSADMTSDPSHAFMSTGTGSVDEKSRRVAVGIVEENAYEVRLDDPSGLRSGGSWKVIEVTGRDLDPAPPPAPHGGNGDIEGAVVVGAEARAPTLSPNLRASFCSLLVHAYLDCNSGTVTLSQNTFVWSKVEGGGGAASSDRRITTRLGRKAVGGARKEQGHRMTKPMQLSRNAEGEEMQLYKELQQTIEAHLKAEVLYGRWKKAEVEDALMDTKKAIAAGASPRAAAQAAAAAVDELDEQQLAEAKETLKGSMAMTESLMDLMLKLVDAGFYETATNRLMLQDSVDLIFDRLCQMVDIDDSDPPGSILGLGLSGGPSAKKKKRMKQLRVRKRKQREMMRKRKTRQKEKEERKKLGLSNGVKLNAVAPGDGGRGVRSALVIDQEAAAAAAEVVYEEDEEDEEGGEEDDDEELDGSEEEDEDNTPAAPFMDRFKRKNVLRFLDSIPVMFGVIGLVLVAIIVGFAAGNDACNTVHSHDVYGDSIASDPSGDLSHFHAKKSELHVHTDPSHLHKHSKEPYCGFYIFDLIVSFIFALELTARFYAVWDFVGLFGNPYTVLDIIVVGLDVVVLAAGDILPMDPKILRVLRAVRLLKVYRVYATLKALRNQKKVVRLPKYELPEAYRKATLRETYLKMIEILSQVTRLNQQAQVERLVSGMKGCILSHIYHPHQSDWSKENMVLLVKEATAEAATPEESSVTGIKYYKLKDQSKEQEKAVRVAALAGIRQALPAVQTLPGSGPHSEMRSALPRLLDLHHSHELHDMVLRLVMHEYTPLVEATLTFLMLHHTQHNQLITDLQQVQLVMRKQEEHLFESHRKELNFITKTLESALAQDHGADEPAGVAPGFKRVALPGDEVSSSVPAPLAPAASGLAGRRRSNSVMKRCEETRDMKNLLKGFVSALKTIEALTQSMARLDDSWVFSEPDMVCVPFAPAQIMLRHLGAASFFQRWRSSIDLGLAFANDMHADTQRRVLLKEGDGCPPGLGGRAGELKYLPSSLHGSHATPTALKGGKSVLHFFLEPDEVYEVVLCDDVQQHEGENSGQSTGDYSGPGSGGHSTGHSASHTVTVRVAGRQLEHNADPPLQKLVQEVKQLCNHMYMSLNNLTAMFVQRNPQNQTLLGNSDSLKELQELLVSDAQAGEHRGSENLLMELLRDNKSAVATMPDTFIDDTVKLIYRRITSMHAASSAEVESQPKGSLEPGHARWEGYNAGKLFQLLCRVNLVGDVPKPKAQLMTLRSLCQPSPATMMPRLMLLCADATVQVPGPYANSLPILPVGAQHAGTPARACVVDQGMSASEIETPRRLRAVLDAIDLARMGRRMTGPPADDERIDEANGEEPGELAADMLDPFMTTEAAAADEQVVAIALEDLQRCDTGGHTQICRHGEQRWKCTNTKQCGITWHTRRALMRMTARARRKCEVLEHTFEGRTKDSNDWMVEDKADIDSTPARKVNKLAEGVPKSPPISAVLKAGSSGKGSLSKLKASATKATRLGNALSAGLNDSIVLNRTKRVLMRVKDTRPPALSYILQLLELLCLCCAGGVNMVEARVQRMYPLADMLSVICHRDTIIDVKLVFARLLFEAYIDVEVPVPGFSSDELLAQMWEYIITHGRHSIAATVKDFEQYPNWSSKLTVYACWHIQQRMQLTFDAMLPTIWIFFRIHYSKYAEQHHLKEYQRTQRREIEALHDELVKLRLLYTTKRVPVRGEAMLYTHTCIETLQEILVRAELKEMREGGSTWASSAPSYSLASAQQGSRKFTQALSSPRHHDSPRSIPRQVLGGRMNAHRKKSRSSSLHGLVIGPTSHALATQKMEVKRQVAIMREERLRLRRRHSVNFEEIVDPFENDDKVDTHDGVVKSSDNVVTEKTSPSSRAGKGIGLVLNSGSSLLHKIANHGHSEDKSVNKYIIMSNFHHVAQRVTFSPDVKGLLNARMSSLCKFIFKLPRERAETYRALRFEPLLAKLVRHARAQIHVVGNMRKVLEPVNEKTTEWLLDLFIQMIETQWGFKVHERDELGDDDSDRKVAEIQGVLNRNNCTALCIELVASGIKDGIIEKALRLLMALLFKEGGHNEVQSRVYRLLTKPANIYFFEKAKQIISEYTCFHENEEANAAYSSPDQNSTFASTHNHLWNDLASDSALGAIDSGDVAKMMGQEMAPHQHKHGDDDRNRNSHGIGRRASGKVHEVMNAATKEAKHIKDKVLGHQPSKKPAHRMDNREVAQSLEGGPEGGLAIEKQGTARRPPHTKLVTCLQLMCEGHCLANQNVLREQAIDGIGTGPEPVNLLKNIVDAFIPISAQRNASGLMTTVELAKVLLETVQGPCPRNQHFIAVDTEFLEATNPLFLLKPGDYALDPGDFSEAIAEGASNAANWTEQDDVVQCKEYCECIACQLTDLKRTLLKIFVGLVEKHRRPSKVYDRIQSVVHLEQLQKFVSPPPLPLDPKMDAMEAMEFLERQQLEREKPLTPVQGHGLVVIQMLFDYDPQLRHELKIEKDVEERLSRELREIEIVWGEGDDALVVKRRFRKDKLMKYLADATKTQLVQEVERDSQEAKHQDFIRRTQFIVWELRHMKMLDDAGLLIFFNRETQDQATWVTFFINLAINFTYLFTMRWRDEGCGDNEIYFVNQYGDGPHNGHGDRVCIDKTASGILLFFNCSQITLSIFTLVLYVIVRCPAIYNLTKESKER